MCEMMGIEPNPEEIPVDENDLSIQSQLALEVYQYLSENWSDMAYLGKNLNGITEIFDILDIHNKYDKLLIIRFIKIIDSHVSEEISRKIKEQTRSKT